MLAFVDIIQPGAGALPGDNTGTPKPRNPAVPELIPGEMLAFVIIFGGPHVLTVKRLRPGQAATQRFRPDPGVNYRTI